MDNKKIEEENAKNDNNKCTENKKKRKVLVNKAKKACFNCKKSHRKCEDNRPCENCKKAGLRCYDTRKKLPHELNLPPMNNGMMHPIKNMGCHNPNMMHNHHPNNLPIKYNQLPNHPNYPIKNNMAPPLKMGPGKNFFPNNPNLPVRNVNMFPMNPMHFNNIAYVNGHHPMNGANNGNGALVQPINGVGKLNTAINSNNNNINVNINNISINKNIINNNTFNNSIPIPSNNNNYFSSNQITNIGNSSFDNLPFVPSNTPLVTNLNSMGGKDSLFLNDQEDLSNLSDLSLMIKGSSSPISPDIHPISPSHDIIPFNQDDNHPKGTLDLLDKGDIFNLIEEVALKKDIVIQNIDQKQFFDNLIPNVNFDPSMFLNGNTSSSIKTENNEPLDPKEFNFEFEGDMQLVETTPSNKRLKLESLEDLNDLDNEDFFDLLMNGSDEQKDERYFKKYALYFPTIPPIFMPFSALRAGTMFSMVSWHKNLSDDGFHPANMFIEDMSVSMCRSMGYNPNQILKRLTPIAIDYSPQQLKQYSKEMLELAKVPVRYFDLYTCLQHHTGLYVSVEISCALFSENNRPSMMFSFVKNTRLLESIAPERHKPIFELMN